MRQAAASIAQTAGDETMPRLHLVKLSVGTDSIDDLNEWQAARSAERAAAGGDSQPRHVTRMWPRRAEQLLRGGSLYWVIRGVICVRQTIDALEPVTGSDGVTRCAIVLGRGLTRVEPRRRGAFQGWRYLAAADAPRDLPPERAAEPALPPGLREALARYGVGGS